MVLNTIIVHYVPYCIYLKEKSKDNVKFDTLNCFVDTAWAVSLVKYTVISVMCMATSIIQYYDVRVIKSSHRYWVFDSMSKKSVFCRRPSQYREIYCDVFVAQFHLRY